MKRHRESTETHKGRLGLLYCPPMFSEETFPPAFKTLIQEKDLQERVGQLGAEITRDYEKHGEDLVLIGVLKGSILFMAGVGPR